MPARKKSTSAPLEAPKIEDKKSGFVDGVFFLTDEEIRKVKKESGFRWPREGYVNLQGGWDPITGNLNSPLLKGEFIFQLVIGPLTPSLAAEIQHLDISYNAELEVVESKEELMKLTRLKFLEFKYAGRKEIPIWIQNLPAIETVLMGVNEITVLPSWLTEKPGMKVISLFMNHLEEIESFGGIEELNIAANRLLHRLPTLHHGSKLKDLAAERCDLDELPQSLFEGELIKCVVNHNPGLGESPLPNPPRETRLRLFSATFCGFAEIPPPFLRPDIFVKI